MKEQSYFYDEVTIVKVSRENADAYRFQKNFRKISPHCATRTCHLRSKRGRATSELIWLNIYGRK